jgi:Na+/H+ antiporter NhaD/arsenite permease-like protein
MLFLSSPALFVLGVGIVCEVVEIFCFRRTNARTIVGVANIPLLSTLFGLALVVAVVARVWSYPAHLMATAGPWATAAIGAGSANVMNNLPASALLSSSLPAHPYELLLGLDLGPNLLVIGAMSSLLWLRIARQNGASPSIRTFSSIGAVVTIVTLAASLVIIT